MPLADKCLEAVLIMDIYPYVTDKPMWLDELL